MGCTLFLRHNTLYCTLNRLQCHVNISFRHTGRPQKTVVTRFIVGVWNRIQSVSEVGLCVSWSEKQLPFAGKARLTWALPHWARTLGRSLLVSWCLGNRSHVTRLSACCGSPAAAGAALRWRARCCGSPGPRLAAPTVGRA